MLFATETIPTINEVWYWVVLWKVMLIGTVGGFACMAIWVIIGGAADIKRLFSRLIVDHERDEQQQQEIE